MTSQGNEGGDTGSSVPSSWFRSSPMSSEAFPIEADDESDLDSFMLGTACTESLHDGIPDQWKSSNGLSTTDPSLYKQVAPNGYTYLENYMTATSPQ